MKPTCFFLILLCGLGLLACRKSPQDAPTRAAEPSAASANPTNRLIAEGRLLHLSPIPNPAASPYRDCLFTAILHVESTTRTNLPDRVLLAIPAFRDRHLTAFATLNTNDLVQAELIPFAQAPEPFASMQQADTVTDTRLPVYLAKQPTITKTPTGLGHAPLTSTTHHRRTQVKRDASAIQTRHIQEAITRLETLRDKHGGWDAWTERLRPLHATITTPPTPYFKEPFSIRHYRDLTRRFVPDHPHTRDMVKSLSLLRDGFAALGIDLIVAPVPSRDLLAVDQIYVAKRPADGVWNPQRLRRNLALLEAGIELLDASETLRLNIPKSDHPAFFFESHDGHPTGAATATMGAAIRKRLLAYPNLNTLKAAGTTIEHVQIPSPPAYPNAPFTLTYAHPVARDAAGTPHPNDPTSPILLFGDSFLRNPGFGGICDVVTAQLDHVPHSLMRSSGALEMNRHLARSSLNWSQYTAAVFVLDESLLDPHPEHWVTTPFLELVSERAEYIRLAAKTRTLLDYNTLDDFHLFRPEGHPPDTPGFAVQARPLRAYLPGSATPLSIRCPPVSLSKPSDRPLLLYLRIRTRHPQPLEVLHQDRVIRRIDLNHMENELPLILPPLSNHKAKHTVHLGLRFPGGGNLFIEACKLYESHVRPNPSDRGNRGYTSQAR